MAELPAAIGRYEIVSRLGQGGMGSLYLARDPKIGRLVAIKLVRQEFDSPEARLRFAREAQSAGTLRHPNIVTIFDVDEHDGLPFIAMEYVEGETLGEIVRRKARYPVATRLQWIEDLCAGLAYAHRQGVIHRDVKPANLMLDNEGALKILDFGLARREASKFTQTQTIVGTPHYMSPEQIRAGDVGPRSDIFAVGAVLYEVVTNAEAFPGTVHQAMHRILYEEPRPIREIAADADPAIEGIVARALEKDPARRFDDLAVMRAELAKVRQRLAQSLEEAAPTIALSPQPAVGRRSASGHTPPAGSGFASGSDGASGSRRDSAAAHRMTLQKRRAAQIDAHLTEARRHCDSGAFEDARHSIDQALMLDPDLSAGLQLLDEVAAEEERQQVAQAVSSARAELQQGRLESAEQFAAQASALAPHAPDVVQVRELIETARREIERARQVQDILRRARARLGEGSFEGAIRAAAELLAIDPHNAAAREIDARAHQAIEERAHRAERDAAAQAAVAEARALLQQGDKAGAVARLEAFAPPHDLVTSVLASIRGDAIDDPAAQQPPMPPVHAPAPARRRLPLYTIAGATLVVLLSAGVYRVNRPSTLAVTPPPVAASPSSASAATLPAAALLPPRAAVTPVPAPATKPLESDSDRDAMEAYRLLASGHHQEAAKIVARLARRDPKNEHLRDLRAQIQTAAAATAPAVPVSDQGQTRVRLGSDQGQTTFAGSSPPASGPASPMPAPTPAAARPPELPPARSGIMPGAPVVVARPAAEIERPAIEAAIAEYAKALSNKDLPAVARVRRYTPAEARNWENTFRQFSEYRVMVKVTGPPVVEGDSARIPVEEQFAETAKKGGIQVFLQPRKTEYRLERIGGRWMLVPPQ